MLLVSTVVGCASLPSNRLIGYWISDKTLSEEFNAKHAKLTEEQVDLLDRMLGRMTIDYGNDIYSCPGDGCGFSIYRSVSLLIDTGGNDHYASKHLGFARYDKRFADDSAHSTYWVDASSIALFLDIGGKDKYGGEDRNGTTWGDKPGSDNTRVRNIGVGSDIEKGVIDWHALPVKGRR